MRSVFAISVGDISKVGNSPQLSKQITMRVTTQLSNALLLIIVDVSSIGAGCHATAADESFAPENSFKRLGALFSNSYFRAAESTSINNYAGNTKVSALALAGWLTHDARLLRVASTYFPQVEGGSSPEGENSFYEMRWDRDNGILQVELQNRPRSHWPIEKKHMKIRSILNYPKVIEKDSEAFWRGSLVAAVLLECEQGIKFSDLVAAHNNPLGFTCGEIRYRGSNDSQAIVECSSSKFGTSRAVFEKIGGAWLPVQVRRTLNSDQRQFVPADEYDNRLKNYRIYSDFPNQNAVALDGMEILCKFTYLGGKPKSIVKRETRLFRDAKSVFQQEVVFDAFKRGGITKNLIAKVQIPIRDGAVVLATDERRKPLQWVMQDGQVMKSLDQSAAKNGEAARFVTSRTAGLMVTTAIAGVLAVLVIYNRIRST